MSVDLLAMFRKAASEGDPPDFGLPKDWRYPTGDDARSAAKREELKLWRTWKEQGHRPEDMEPLLKSLRPLVYRYGVQTWKNKVPLSGQVLNDEATRLTIKGLRRYNPRKAQLNTYVRYQLQSMDRFVKNRQNISRITEERNRLIGPYDKAHATLVERLDREPTTAEIASEMRRYGKKVSVKNVQKLEQERKKDLLASGAMEDPFLEETPKSRRVLRLIRYQLNKDEQKVLDHLTGSNGKRQTSSTSTIARKEGWSDSRVSQIKRAIAKKMKPYL